MDRNARRNGNAQAWTDELTNQRIAAARAGSLESWNSLALNTDKIPRGKQVDVLYLLLFMLEVPDDFDPSVPLPNQLKTRYERVKLALRGIAFVGSPSPDFLGVLVSSWPKVGTLKWAQYYFNVNCTSDGGTREKRTSESNALIVLSSLFDVLSTVNNLYSTIDHRDDTFALLARTWLKLVPNTFVNTSAQSPRALIMSAMASALQDAHASPSWSLAAAREIVLREAGNEPIVVAKVVLTALRDAPAFQTEVASFMRQSAHCLYLLLRREKPLDDNSPFHKALMDKHAIQLVIQTMSHFSLSPKSAHELAEAIAQISLEVIGSIMGAKGAYLLVPRILKAGFLEVAANFIDSFHSHRTSQIDPTCSVLKNITGRLFPIYIVHYPVLSAAIQAMNSIIVSKKIKTLKSSIIRSEWALFFDLLLDRATVKALYDLQFKAQKHLVCHNCWTPGKASGRKVSACSGCKVALYCSQQCQKTAWKTHKMVCEAWKEMVADNYFHVHATFFSPNLVAFDMKRHLPGIFKMRDSDPEFKDAGSDLAYAISYCVEREPYIEISLFRGSSIIDGKTFKSAESHEISSAKFQYALEQVHNVERVQMAHVTYYWGGARTTSVFEGLLPSDFEMPANAVIGCPVGMSNPRRRKALDKQGRELETLWDNIDDIMFTAVLEDEAQNTRAESAEAVTVFERIVRLAKDQFVDGSTYMSRSNSPD